MTIMSRIKEHMEVIGADGVHVGTVDRIEENRIKLTKADSGEGRQRPSSLYRRQPRGRRGRQQGSSVGERRRRGDHGAGGLSLSDALRRCTRFRRAR